MAAPARTARIRRLEIENFGLIHRAVLEIADGLTVCSGETGSGKTMLLGALSFVLGGRASADTVRSGAARARVTLEVETDDALRRQFDEDGFELESGEPAILVRELAATGKSSARINGRAATVAQLRLFGEPLVDFVGQHEQQRLLSRAYQLDLLDRFAAAELEREEIAATHARAVSLEWELHVLREDRDRALAHNEFARFALAEIDQTALEAGEDVRLRERRDYLVNVERIAAALAQAHGALSADGSAVEMLGVAAASLAGVARFGEELARLAETLAGLQSDATEAAVAIAREWERSEFDVGELEATGARLDAVERLKKKYGGTLEAVLEARARFAASIAQVEEGVEREDALGSTLRTTRAELVGRAADLGRQRAKAARVLEIAVSRELAALAMPAARFEVAIETLEAPGPYGSEAVEFHLAPNPGEPLRPLAKAASGGELSRVLLAMVVVLADRRDRSTLVFDEIDAGVGGATANAVGARLGLLARNNQILCVTHLAQIGSWADRHYALRKHEEHDSATIELVELREGDAVLEELARMLSGSAATVALEHAATMLRQARTRKASTKLKV